MTVVGAERTQTRLRAADELAPSPPGNGPLSLHSTMPGYAPSPLRPAPAAAARLGVATVLVKDESSRLGLPSFKILGASWAIARALAGDGAGGCAQLLRVAEER
jgi:diaminopropionate ammonia-lyase